jgi:hypothetical protein
MKLQSSLLATALTDVRSTAALRAPLWDTLIRQARAADLLSALAMRAQAAGVLDTIPAGPRRHLESAARAGAAHRLSVRRETRLMFEAIRGLTRVVLLKGAAYEFADLPIASGRLFNDLDLLVPAEKLGEVESRLLLAGWHTDRRSAYDQRYYRQWMHELPPMRHINRGTSLDVHHAIAPPTGRIQADSQAMLDAAVPISGENGLFVLAPADMILHSATHLFHEGEFDHGLRDLVDLDGLLRHFADCPGFWASLIPRARAVGLTRPLYYALRYAQRMLGTPVPDEVVRASRIGAPVRLLGWLMDGLFLRALNVKHPTVEDAWTPLARRLLYVRGHWLRMPIHLLAYHLAHKALARDDTREPKVTDREGR